jgi:hypothetical protein
MKRPAAMLLGVALIGSAACAGVLGLKPPGHRPFEHRAHALKGVPCLRCHTGIAAAGEEGPLHVPDTAACVTCHEKPHETRDCNRCHGLPHTREAVALARTNLRFEHKTHMPRVHGECVRCHVDVAIGGPVLRPTMATCTSCHPHGDELATLDCSACHVELHQEGVKPSDHLVHEGDFIKTHGIRAAGARELCATCHGEGFCTGCHGKTSPTIPERLSFDDPMRPGVHRAGFLARHPEEARSAPGLCTTCHAPDSCATCHERERLTAPRAGSTSPHPRGWLGPRGSSNDHGHAAWRDPALCASCHGGAGEAMCVGCHRVGGIGGNPHAAGFSSNKRARIDMPCRLCHGG